jgi:hypothetical protein
MFGTKRPHLICLAALLLIAAGCRREKAKTVEDVAGALRANGVPYDVSETAALTGIRGQGLRLTGRGLAVEIYRVEDQGQMQLASSAAEIASVREPNPIAGTRGPSPSAPTCYVKPPFLIVVRREPTDGEVAAALARVLGD